MNEWKAAKDELPKLPDSYSKDGILYVPVADFAIVFDGENVHVKSYDANGFNDDSITHWMYFPDPPKI